MKILGKTYSNTKKGKGKVPTRPCAYSLKGRSGKVKYYGETNNLSKKRREEGIWMLIISII